MYSFFRVPAYVKTLMSLQWSGPQVGVVRAGVDLCAFVHCRVCVCVCARAHARACSLQGSHHPNITTGQLVSWAHNHMFSYPPFFMGDFYDYYFYQQLQAEVHLLEGSHSPVVQPGGQRGRV